MRKIIQLAMACQAPYEDINNVRQIDDELVITALCDDGTAWLIRPDLAKPRWTALPIIPAG